MRYIIGVLLGAASTAGWFLVAMSGSFLASLISLLVTLFTLTLFVGDVLDGLEDED